MVLVKLIIDFDVLVKFGVWKFFEKVLWIVSWWMGVNFILILGEKWLYFFE